MFQTVLSDSAATLGTQEKLDGYTLEKALHILISLSTHNCKQFSLFYIYDFYNQQGKNKSACRFLTPLTY